MTTSCFVLRPSSAPEGEVRGKVGPLDLERERGSGKSLSSAGFYAMALVESMDSSAQGRMAG